MNSYRSGSPTREAGISGKEDEALASLGKLTL